VTVRQGAAGDVGSEAAYYQTIEEFFVSRRGDPLLLSNADWLLIRKWRRAGIPLRVVLRGIGDALDGHAHSWGRHRRVGSLQYCAAEVEVARDRWTRALTQGSDDGDVERTLDDLLRTLAEARHLGDAEGQVVARITGELRLLGGRGAAEVEGKLGALERELLLCVRRELGEDEVSRAEAEVDAELEPYRGRMPGKVAAQIREDALARRMLAARGLPRLTLFFR
jgi:hypothetical protein